MIIAIYYIERLFKKSAQSGWRMFVAPEKWCFFVPIYPYRPLKTAFSATTNSHQSDAADCSSGL
ncbi:hypothetical protein ATPR_1211 [Acetobacter tropicalis NBRC 101654]|uniref:Uncharacterized protein n=1 Tax=Acetobacter tropicalis NBRC 101654 TaxID=749388 RepID=F7VCW2_9PROT|nr:hypothetical protein ATPR_1211 [Acetobacter tropicalis NBRC 101654]